MEQLVEMRANPLEFPQGAGKPNVKGHELIFIASTIDYSVDMRGNVMQVQQAVVHRFMATPASLAQMAAHCLALLPEDVRAKVLDIDYAEEESGAQHPKS